MLCVRSGHHLRVEGRRVEEMLQPQIAIRRVFLQQLQRLSQERAAAKGSGQQTAEGCCCRGFSPLCCEPTGEPRSMARAASTSCSSTSSVTICSRGKGHVRLCAGCVAGGVAAAGVTCSYSSCVLAVGSRMLAVAASTLSHSVNATGSTGRMRTEVLSFTHPGQLLH